MKTLCSLSLILAPLLMSACTVPPTPIEGLRDSFLAAVDVKKAVGDYISSSDPGTRKNLRNSILSAKIAEIDAGYQRFVSGVAKTRAATNVVLDIAAVGLDVGATLAGSSSAKSLLAALSGVSTSSRAVLNKELYAEAATEVIVAQMKSSRGDVMSSILISMMKEDDAYPLISAISDLAKYSEAGTLENALSILAMKAASGNAQYMTGLRSLFRLW